MQTTALALMTTAVCNGNGESCECEPKPDADEFDDIDDCVGEFDDCGVCNGLDFCELDESRLPI